MDNETVKKSRIKKSSADGKDTSKSGKILRWIAFFLLIAYLILVLFMLCGDAVLSYLSSVFKIEISNIPDLLFKTPLIIISVILILSGFIFWRAIASLFKIIYRGIKKQAIKIHDVFNRFENKLEHEKKIEGHEARLQSPIRDLYDREKEYLGSFDSYYSKLKYVFENDNVSNIAIVGNFGVGKSSIIRSFEAMDRNRNQGYLYISLIDYKNEIDFYGRKDTNPTSEDEKGSETGGSAQTQNSSENGSGSETGGSAQTQNSSENGSGSETGGSAQTQNSSENGGGTEAGGSAQTQNSSENGNGSETGGSAQTQNSSENGGGSETGGSAQAQNSSENGEDSKTANSNQAKSSSENELELFESYLLSTILARANEIRLPYSGYKLIPKKTKIRDLLFYVSLSLFVLSGVCVLFYDKLFPENHPQMLQFLGPYPQTVVYIIFSVCLVAFIISGFFFLKKKLYVDSISLKKGDAEAKLNAKDPHGKEYIDGRLFEMMYALENIAPEIGHTVVIEDMDRIDPEIAIVLFSKLNRISKMLNNRFSKNIVRFIYVFSDEIFGKVNRNRFFDYVLSAQPIVSRADAGYYLKDRIEASIDSIEDQEISQTIDDPNSGSPTTEKLSYKSKLKIDIKDDRMEYAWILISRCVYDIRMINAIIDNYEIIVDGMKNRGIIPSEHLLPFVIYKHLLPKDYHNSFSGDTVLAYGREKRDTEIKKQLNGNEIYKRAVCDLIAYFIGKGLLDDNYVYSSHSYNSYWGPTMHYKDELDYLINNLRFIYEFTPNGAIKKSRLLTRIGDICERRNKYKDASEYYRKAVNVLKSFRENETYLIDAFIHLGTVHEKMQHYSDAEKNYEDALKLAEKYGLRNMEMKIKLRLIRVKTMGGI